MKPFDWSIEKNEWLQKERGVSFDQVLIAIQSGDLLDDTDHPNKKRYSKQRIFVVNINNYVYLVPYVEDDEKIFLKTVIPSRKATKKYITK